MKEFYFPTIFVLCLLVTFSCSNDTPTEEQPLAVVDSVSTKPILKPVVDTISLDTVAIDTNPIPQKIERPSRKPPKMEFETTTYSYDTIQQGDVIEYSFKFKNIGERPLSIKEVKGSCGCTIGSYPFLDIAPNEENAIKARFDSKNKKGSQKTTVTVVCNGEPSSYILTLKGYVNE